MPRNSAAVTFAFQKHWRVRPVGKNDFNSIDEPGGLSVAPEDCIMQKGRPAHAGSMILEGFTSPVDAAVVSRLEESAFEISNRTKMSEFGVENIPFDGFGEVSEAVSLVKKGSVSFALCNDVFGRYRCESAEQDICYIRPAYGTVSRYGLIPAVPSMDQIGVVCENPLKGFSLLEVIAGYDAKDGAMFPNENYYYAKKDACPRIVAAKDDIDIREFFNDSSVTNLKLEYFDVYDPVMYILTRAELSGSISRYDGIRFGRRAADYAGLDELYLKTRTEMFSSKTKIAAVMGAFVLSHENYSLYYEKAMRIRRLIKESLRFDCYDVIAVSPGNPLAVLCGLPSISFSYNKTGVQLVAEAGNEGALLTAWASVFNGDTSKNSGNFSGRVK